MGYWQDRQEAMYKAGEMRVNQYFSRLEKAFNQTKRELQKTVEAFYWRYAKENGLSYAAAQKRLDKAEIGELKDFIELSMANIGKYSQEVNNLSIKARITRYQALEAQVDAILRQLYAIDYEAAAEQTMKDVYGETYYRTWYNIDQYRGFHSAFAQVDPVTVEKLLEYPFNGANFSSRLWKQKDHLQTQLMEAITTVLIQGVPPQKLAADFAKKMQSKKFDAYRLLHTESSFLMSEAAHAGYREDGVEKYQVLATLDSKTCGVCGDLDGNVYATEKAVTGVNMPPFHPLCRCTDVPYYDDTDLSNQTRAARDPETGETYAVPADMTYKEWKSQFADSKSESKIVKVPEKLSLPENMGKEARKEIEKEISMIPDRHKEIIDSAVNKIVIDQNGNSRYDRVNGILYLASELDAGEVIHEMAHALETELHIWDDPKLMKVIKGTLGGDNPLFDVVDDVDTFVLPVQRLDRPDVLVSLYQGRIYEEVGSVDADWNFNYYSLGEFFSEAYREYIMKPENLKQKQPLMFDYIEEMIR